MTILFDGDDRNIKLTNYCRYGGCAAKIGPGDLSNILSGIEVPESEDVVAGIKDYEDAGIYRINDELAIVQTVDFFTPVVNDPYWFGQIAAANALSDIYAMGAKPITALNIVCFSPKKYGNSVLQEILKGGIDKIRESGASLLGGHSVDDEEIKYGLSVTGIVNLNEVVRNEGAMPGDVLILTKPLGTGILITSLKAGALSKIGEKSLVKVMAALNNYASEAMLFSHAHAATDVSGFGLVGHLKEMIKNNLGVEVYAKNLPYLPEAKKLAASGFLPSGLYRNRDFYISYVKSTIKGPLYDLIFDPQSSGGLLISLDESEIGRFKEKASQSNLDFWVIGRFIEKPKGIIYIR